MNLYVGNLSYDVSGDDLRNAFEAYGSVSSCRLITDRDTGQSKGFAFVEMDSNSEADAAIKGLNDQQLKGRAIKVNQARPASERSSGGGGRPRY